MNADFTAAELAFRAEVREFLANEFPAELKQKVDNRIRLSKDEIVGWQKILYKKGWMAPNWPQEYGGTGWTATRTCSRWSLGNSFGQMRHIGALGFRCCRRTPECPGANAQTALRGR